MYDKYLKDKLSQINIMCSIPTTINLSIFIQVDQHITDTILFIVIFNVIVEDDCTPSYPLILFFDLLLLLFLCLK